MTPTIFALLLFGSLAAVVLVSAIVMDSDFDDMSCPEDYDPLWYHLEESGVCRPEWNEYYFNDDEWAGH